MMVPVFLRAVGCLAAAAAAGGNAAVPKVAFTAGYNNSNCEAHPHAGVELADGGWLMVGDSVCWDGSAAYDRAVFVVATERDGAERWTRVLGDRGAPPLPPRGAPPRRPPQASTTASTARSSPTARCWSRA